jgi:hypothetical protein
MDSLTAEIILQTEQSDGTFRCTGYCGVPAARGSWIAIVSAGSDSGRKLARALSTEIDAVLRGSSPGVETAPIDGLADPSKMKPAANPGRRKLLVLVGAEDRKFQNLAWYNHWQSDEHHSFVMTVIPPVPFESLIDDAILNNPQHLLRRINASAWRDRIGESLPAVLARAEITSAATSVFISYRRVETLAIALQLFDRLTHEGFDVFLDRFTIPAGYDFQRRLAQELEAKSMVVLLESKFLRDSKWTQREIDFVKRHRLGLATLRMPDVEPDDILRSATIGSHVTLKHAPGVSDFAGDPKPVPNPERPGEMMNQWPELKDDTLASVVGQIKTAHAKALFRRRHILRQDLVAALKSSGVDAQYRAVGPLVVKVGADEHLIWLTTRPPEVDDFHAVYTTHFARKGLSAGSRGLIVGPQAALEPDRRERLQWLHTVSQCLSFDEGNLSDFARRVAAGAWK